MNSLNENEYEALPEIEKKKYILEWRCSCNECQNIWNYLDGVEKQLKNEEKINSTCGAGPCSSVGEQAQVKNVDVNLKQQIRELKTCTKCGSRNVTREKRYFKKQQL